MNDNDDDLATYLPTWTGLALPCLALANISTRNGHSQRPSLHPTLCQDGGQHNSNSDNVSQSQNDQIANEYNIHSGPSPPYLHHL